MDHIRNEFGEMYWAIHATPIGQLMVDSDEMFDRVCQGKTPRHSYKDNLSICLCVCEIN
jgi:hypothetical protein